MQRKELERKVEMKAHVRYETPAGNQLQVDWKENLSTVLKTGEIIEYNLFVATLGYSRYHFYIYSKSKATDDFLRCLIEVLQRMGGIPKMVVTDNMSAIVSIRANSRDKLPVIRQFEKDYL
jgi:transposase